jgi:AraC-like DNA-binding protein
MLIVETIDRVRRKHLDKGKSIKEIARNLHLSRDTVRRILRSGGVFRTGGPAAPEARSVYGSARPTSGGERQGAGVRAADADPRFQGVACARLRGRLRRGSPTRAALGRAARERAEAYIPLTFAPGEAYQFDWSHEIVVVDGVTTTVSRP